MPTGCHADGRALQAWAATLPFPQCILHACTPAYRAQPHPSCPDTVQRLPSAERAKRSSVFNVEQVLVGFGGARVSDTQFSPACSFPKSTLLERRGRGGAPNSMCLPACGESGSGAAARAWLGHDSLDSFLDSSPDERLFTAYSTSTLRVVAANLGEVAVVPPRAPDASVPRIPGFRSLALVVKLMRRCWVREAQKGLAEGDQIRSPRVRCPPLGASHDVVHEAHVSVACQQAALRVILCGGGG